MTRKGENLERFTRIVDSNVTVARRILESPDGTCKQMGEGFTFWNQF